jgi:rhodanese-related sulfurtransferase
VAVSARNFVRGWAAASLVGAALASGVADAQTVRVSVAMDPSDGASELLTLAVANSPLSRILNQRVIVLPQRDLTDAMRSSRTQENDVIIAPAHVVASALTHGYELVASSGTSSKFVLVGNAGLGSVADLKGKRAYFPSQDSLRSYVARGLLTQAGLTPRSLKHVTYAETSGAGMMSVAGGMVEATVALEEEWDAWVKANPKAGRVLAASEPLPSGVSVVVRKDASPALKRAVVQWVTTTDSLIPGMPRLRATTDAGPYEYVASLGIFTPSEIRGVQRVTARQALDLSAKGARLIDVRTEKEFKLRSARGAILAPYAEKSLKAIDFDHKLDNFSGLAKLNLPKNDPVVFFCNGPECWKSYKASIVARDTGFTQVFWLRGGVPEWVAQGLPTSEP